MSDEIDRRTAAGGRVMSLRTASRRGAVGVALVAAGVALASATTGDAKSRLRVSATPANVVAGKTIKVRITGTRARRCRLTLRADRFRARPYSRQRVGLRSTLKISARSTPGARIVTVHCGRAQAFTSIRIGEPRAGGDSDVYLPEPEPKPTSPDDTSPLDGYPPEEWSEDEFPFEEEQPPVEVPPPPPLPPPPGTPPDTSPPSKPAGLARAAGTTTSITLSWNAATDNVGVKGYSVFRGATRVANVPETSYKFTGLACGKSYTLGVAAFDAVPNTSATATLAASTAACPVRKVSVAKGDSAQGRPGCKSSHCRYLKISFSNYSSGSHTIVCRASGGDEGGFYTYSRTGGSNTSAVCYYGFPGRTVWATVDGVASNKITW